MKNKLFLIFFSLFLSVVSGAQTGRLGEHSTITKWTEPGTGIPGTVQGMEIAKRILDAVGLRTSLDVRPANIDNAAAVVYGGKRYVLYNPAFIYNLIKTTGTDWAAISVLAHKIGHHLNGHTVSGSGSQPNTELEADEFSGFVLRKMGASLAQAQAAMQTLASAGASRTHPAKDDRLTAIAQGWDRAGDQMAARQPVRTKPEAPQPSPAPNDVANNTRPALLSRYILGDVYFAADPASRYLITADYNLVKVAERGVNILGKLEKLNSAAFPYRIYDAQNTTLLVDSRGNIVTRAGKRVGLLKNHTG